MSFKNNDTFALFIINLNKNSQMKKLSLFTIGTLIVVSSACKKDEDSTIQLRTKVDASGYTQSTVYKSSFVDAKSTTTVDFTSGNTKLNMFKGLNTYINLNKLGLINANVSKNLFANIGNPFIAEYSPEFATLNSAGFGIKGHAASSLSAPAAEAVRLKIEADLTENAGLNFAIPATKGVAGKLGGYMVTAKGIEPGQIIQKGLIGAFQLDYIGNVLLTAGLNADNTVEVSGKNYTALEHNWDEAYATLTTSDIIYTGYTPTTTPRTESFLGAYIWEYNRANYDKIYLAFLKGRAAIVNNNRTELNKQALFIRTQFETAIAEAALGYLTKWGDPTYTDDKRAHAISEGLGFIYSMRFCTVNKVDASFSDSLLNDLIGSANGAWDLTPAKTAAATVKIKTKFNIQ